MTPPSRQTPSGRAYLDLRAKAKREGRPTDELFVLYILERFLYRLSNSDYQTRLILKGGMLLAAFDERRPTADVDLLAQAINNNVESISEVIREIVSVLVEDGVTFEPEGLRASTIRDVELYSGVRITVPARIDRARHPLRLDINIGDPVTPAPVRVNFPALLGEPFELLGYPLATVLAEKIVTMVDRGNTTTRDRDFADVVVLTARHSIAADELTRAVQATGSHRGSVLRPLREVLSHLGTSRSDDWSRFVTRSGLSDAVPASFVDAIDLVADFADPVLTGTLTHETWNPNTRQWHPPRDI